MAQHDYSLANQDGASFRSDLNNALSAIVSNNSGTSAPSTTFAYQLWADTTNAKLFQRNAANSAWVEIGKLGIAYGMAVPAGTKMLFQQTSAPTGWTKDATFNNRALRIVSGSVGFGGSTPFTTIFGPSKLTGGHVLTIAEMPSHSHTGGEYHQQNFIGGASGAFVRLNVGAPDNDTGFTGGGGAHDHPLALDLEFCDAIIAIKDG